MVLGGLSTRQRLDRTNYHMKNAWDAMDKDRKLAVVLCEDAESALSRARNAARWAPKYTNDLELRKRVVEAYRELGRLQEHLERREEAQDSYKRARKLRQVEHLTLSLCTLESLQEGSSPLIPNAQIDTESHEENAIPPHNSNPISSQSRSDTDIATVAPSIFAEDIRPLASVYQLPKADRRLKDTPQLTHCLRLLQAPASNDRNLDAATLTWLKGVRNDSSEQERLKTLAINVVRAFKRDEMRNAKAVAEVVILAPVLEKDDFRALLREFFSGIEQSKMLDVSQLEGLAQVIQRVPPGHVDADDLVKILELLNERLIGTHLQSSAHTYQLTLTVSHVLDAMANASVKGLDRVKLHDPLSVYLEELKGSTDPYLVYQAAYAFQALQHVPNDDTPLRESLRRLGKVVQGVSGLVSSLKAVDLNRFIESLHDVGHGITGSDIYRAGRSAIGGLAALADGGQTFVECLKESCKLRRKQPWYAALHGASVLIENGQFTELKEMVCQTSVRRDPAFQWGVCQRLGEIAASPGWNMSTRQSAIAFLGEMFENDEAWGQNENIKDWILDILIQLEAQDAHVGKDSRAFLRKLESNGDTRKKELYHARREKGPSAYPLKVPLLQLGSPSLLDRVQNKLDVEDHLHQLRSQRRKERGKAVYIRPQAKASRNAPDEELFPLMETVERFLDSKQKVMLILGDSGAGKSTFNRELEYELWQEYKKDKTNRIPLYINLPAIEKPEHDMIAKQLRRADFTEPQIREMKGHREFILICDGYDESQQTQNLYWSNRLNQPGEWKAQMIISCRSEYLGDDYRDRFQPIDRNRRADPGAFLEAVIAPFSRDQIHNYIQSYVSSCQPPWDVDQYLQALELVPSLIDLVKNPFLLTLSLEVLPRMVDPGEHLTTARITRVALYDQFVEQWLERGKKRLGEKPLTDQERAALESLSDEGLVKNGIHFLKSLALEIYMNQGGYPVVEYSRFNDENSWKAKFFKRDDETKLLREACPLSRSGSQYKFVHRTLLEYALTLAVFDPRDGKNRAAPVHSKARRGSISSVLSFEVQGGLTEAGSPIIEQHSEDLKSPLVNRNFVGENSLTQFLQERAQQEPVFREQLSRFVELSKNDPEHKWRVASANAMTILVRAGIQFNNADLQGVKMPGADLSHGTFDSARLNDTDMRKVKFYDTWLRQADMTGAKMTGVQFGELPYLTQECEVLSCAYSPDGKYFAVGLRNNAISVYTTWNWEQIQLLKGHKAWVQCVAFSPSSAQLASGSHDHDVRLWDVATWTCFRILEGHTAPVVSLCYIPCHDQDQIASGSWDNSVRLWSSKTGESICTIPGDGRMVLSVAFSPSGNQVATGSDDHKVRLLETATRASIGTLDGHTEAITMVMYSPNGKMLASASADTTVRLWNLETMTRRHVLTGHTQRVNCIVYSPRGDMIITGSDDKSMKLWDVETGRCLHTLSGYDNVVTSVAFSPVGTQIASSGNDGTVRLWYVDSTTFRHTPGSRTESISSAVFSPSGNHAASGSGDGTVRMWEVETGDCLQTFNGQDGAVTWVVYSPNGTQVASASDKTVRLWSLNGGNCPLQLSGHTENVSCIAYSSDGRLIASGSHDKSVRLWSTQTEECQGTLTGHADRVTSVVFSPKGRCVASSSEDRTVRLWSPETGACINVLNDHKNKVTCIAFSSDEKWIASGCQDHKVRLWSVESGFKTYTFQGDAPITCLAYSPTGSQVAIGASNDKVWLWNTGAEDGTLMGSHAGKVTRVLFSPGGNMIASASDDSTVRLWSTASRSFLEEIRYPASSIAWKPDSEANYLLVGCEVGYVRLWEITERDNQYHLLSKAHKD
ncbi:hypothetical protein BGX31_002162 [Mortierella sp. GBA43]|nr:hypothetical protein BGX31_002162 [Mortierella sp. GBA43]